MGFYIQVEYHTNNGRFDLVLQTSGYIYVMEFKLEEALQQINEKGYAFPFVKDSRTFIKSVSVSVRKRETSRSGWWSNVETMAAYSKDKELQPLLLKEPYLISHPKHMKLGTLIKCD